jgi:hypothetical protein
MANKMETGICKLCSTETELLSQSHIIPDFMYRKLYDEKHKLYRFEPRTYVVGKSYMARPSTGAYEGGILCRKCDSETIGNIEKYACNFITEISRTIECFPNKQVHKFSNAKYAEFKIFILSILWRASISTRKEFNLIDLEDDEPIIRSMILNNDPKSEHFYPIFLYGWTQGDTVATDMIIMPRPVKGKYGKSFVFPINGLIYHIFSDIKDINPQLRPLILSENGEFTINIMNEEWFTKYYKTMLNLSYP